MPPIHKQLNFKAFCVYMCVQVGPAAFENNQDNWRVAILSSQPRHLTLEFSQINFPRFRALN